MSGSASGAVFRQGPAFDLEATFVYGPMGRFPGETEASVGGRGTFHVPDSYGLGVAFRPTRNAVLTMDLVRIEYSDMTDRLVNLLLVRRNEEENYRADDVLETRLGVEVQALHWRFPTSVRAGIWCEPDHRIHYDGERSSPRARFRRGPDEVHGTLGIGVVLGRAQIDLAADISDQSETFSLASVIRFR